MGPWLGAWVAAACLAAAPACTRGRTAVIVVVDTDLVAPAEVSSVRATIGDGGCGDGTCVHDFVTGAPSVFPFSFAIEPRGGDPSAAFTLAVVARDAGGAPVVARHVESAFLAGRTLLLHVRLERACRTVTSCGATDTCVAGACVTRIVDPGLLPGVVPGHELDGLGDAGEPIDGGPLDVGEPIDVGPPTDAGPIDAPVLDAGPPFDSGRPIPLSCAELPGAAPSGLTVIDPDGPGGAPPFDAWCENDLDDGGWTLIAKVDPASTALAYDAAVWTSTNPDDDFGIADVSLGDALLRPYWTVPVSALRVQSGTGSLVLTFDAGGSRTLRAAMDAAPALALSPATTAAWEPLVGTLGTAMLACSRSGVDVAIPDEIAPEIRVRVGFAASTAADCSTPTLWYGAGASVTTTDAMCMAWTNTAGGARVCGSTGQRREVPTFLLVYGR